MKHKWEQPDFFRIPTSLDDAKSQLRKEKKYLKQAQAAFADAEKVGYSIGQKIALDDIAMRSAAIAHIEAWSKAQEPLSRETAAAVSNVTGIRIVDKTARDGMPGLAAVYHTDIVKAIKAGGKLPKELEGLITLDPVAVSGGKIHWIVGKARAPRALPGISDTLRRDDIGPPSATPRNTAQHRAARHRAARA